MAVRLQMNNYVSKLIELWHLGYDAQLVFTSVDGHMGINLQQSILACETVSHRYSQYEHHGLKPTQPQVRRREPQVCRSEQPAKRRRREKRATAREMVGEAAAQVPSSHHQLPVQAGATSHAPPASAPSFLPPFLPTAELVWHDRHPLLPLAEQAGDQQHLPCPQPTEEVSQDLRPHSPATEALPPLLTVNKVSVQSVTPSSKPSAVKAVNTAAEEVALVKDAEDEVNEISAEKAALVLPLLSSDETDPPLPPPSKKGLEDHPQSPPFSSFCFHVPEDSSLHPSTPTVPTRRIRVRRDKPTRPSWAVPTPKSSCDPIRVRMKPAKYLRTPLTLYIEKAIWDSQGSGQGSARWVGDTCSFVRFADSEEGFYTEPRFT